MFVAAARLFAWAGLVCVLLVGMYMLIVGGVGVPGGTPLYECRRTILRCPYCEVIYAVGSRRLGDLQCPCCDDHVEQRILYYDPYPDVRPLVDGRDGGLPPRQRGHSSRQAVEERRGIVVELLKNNPGLRVGDVAAMLGLSARGARHLLDGMVGKGLLRAAKNHHDAKRYYLGGNSVRKAD